MFWISKSAKKTKTEEEEKEEREEERSGARLGKTREREREREREKGFSLRMDLIGNFFERNSGGKGGSSSNTGLLEPLLVVRDMKREKLVLLGSGGAWEPLLSFVSLSLEAK